MDFTHLYLMIHWFKTKEWHALQNDILAERIVVFHSPLTVHESVKPKLAHSLIKARHYFQPSILAKSYQKLISGRCYLKKSQQI
jgi:hypothetical protein